MFIHVSFRKTVKAKLNQLFPGRVIITSGVRAFALSAGAKWALVAVTPRDPCQQSAITPDSLHHWQTRLGTTDRIGVFVCPYVLMGAGYAAESAGSCDYLF